MAGDWIKMTHALPEKPEVLAIAGRTGLNRFEVVGRLFSLWRWFDINTTDGNAVGVTLVTLEECLFGYQSATNFVTEVLAVRWLCESDNGISVVNFDEHISESAKTRAQTAKRVAKSKNKAKGNAEGNGESVTSSVTKTVPREEKRREEEDIYVARGDLPQCNPQSIVALYHEVLPELPAVRLMNEARKKALGKLWRFVLTSTKTDGTRRAYDADQAMTWLRDYFSRARDNDFLMGRTGRVGEHSNWQCDLDFLLTDKGMKHVIEKTKENA